jgi:hypothetical protein
VQDRAQDPPESVPPVFKLARTMTYQGLNLVVDCGLLLFGGIDAHLY